MKIMKRIEDHEEKHLRFSSWPYTIFMFFMFALL